MGGIVFPKEVEDRLEAEAQISKLSDDAISSTKVQLKLESILPISVGDASIGSARPSLTTTAIAAARLPRPFSNSLFDGFFSLCEKETEKSKTLSSPTFGHDNPITASFIAIAYERFSRTSEKPYAFSINQILSWIQKPSDDKKLRAYPAMLAYEALSTLPPRGLAPLRRKAKKVQQKLFSMSQAELMNQIAYYHSGHAGYFDPGELAYWALLGSELSLYSNSPLLTEAMKIICASQSGDSILQARIPFWYEAGKGALLASSQIMSALVRTLRRRPDLYRQYEKQIHQYVEWLGANRAVVAQNDNELKGWASEHDFSRTRIDFYVTLENIRVLRTIRSLIRRINRHDLLRRSGLTVNWKPLRWSDLLPTDLSAPSGKQIKNQLETLLVNPIKRGKSVDTRSAVFYGPPGTSKTSIAEALADALSERGRRWLFVTITPGDFIAGGEAMAEINADNIFRILNELPNVVILFDEIDQLLGDRDNRENRSGGALQFMTTSMLTKFQKLRQRKINVFVLTTNKFEKLDSAIRRAGRFDQHVAVMPPDAPSRVAILKKLLKKFDKERNMDFLRRLKNRGLLEVANRTCLFTYPELQALLSDVLPFLPAATEGKEIQKELIDKAANYSRATSFASYMNERRLGADKEIAILLSTISEAEFKLFTTEDRENFVSLAKTVQASEFKSKLPGWVLSPGVIGELSTPRRDIRST